MMTTRQINKTSKKTIKAALTPTVTTAVTNAKALHALFYQVSVLVDDLDTAATRLVMADFESGCEFSMPSMTSAMRAARKARKNITPKLKKTLELLAWFEANATKIDREAFAYNTAIHGRNAKTPRSKKPRSTKIGGRMIKIARSR